MCELKKFARRPTGHNLAGLQQNDFRTQQQGFPQVVCDENDRLLETEGERPKLTLQFRSRDRVECAKGFVHQKDRRIRGEGTRYTYALALPTREFARAPVREFARFKPYQFEHLVHTLVDPLAGPVFQRGDKRHILGNRKMRKQSGFLDYVTNPPPKTNRIPFPGGLLLDKDFSSRGDQHPIYQFQESGLAAAASPEQDDRLAMRNH